MKRKVGLVVAGLLVAVAPVGAGRAWAHATFEKNTAPADSHSNLTLNVPAEKQGAVNSAIHVELPEGFEAHSCTAGEGWSCSVDNHPQSTDPRGPVAQITFTHLGCTPGSRCNAAKPAEHQEVGMSAASRSVSFDRVLHEPGQSGMPGDEAAAEGQAFAFEVHTPAKAGDYPINVAQYYSDGDSVRWDGAQGSEHPAPVVRVS